MRVLGLQAIFLLLLAGLGAHAGAQTGGGPGNLKGRVKEQKGKSLAGVMIKATSEGRQFEAQSNDQGEFELKGLPAGEYVLSFSKTGYKNFTTRRLAVAAGETIRLSRMIELVREDDPYAVIRGAIFHGVGYTLPNAEVTLERIDGKKKIKMETVSREGGEFAFRLKADQATYRITARAQGFQPASIEIAIENDEVRNVALTLNPKP